MLCEHLFDSCGVCRQLHGMRCVLAVAGYEVCVGSVLVVADAVPCLASHALPRRYTLALRYCVNRS